MLPRLFSPLLSFSLIFSFLLFSISIEAQNVLINRLWDVSYGSPGAIDWNSSTLSPSKNLITTGNQQLQNGDVVLTLINQAVSGNVIWQKTFSNGLGSKSYGTKVVTDVLGSIYVCGVTQTSTLNKNIVVLKYDDLGNLIWSYFYDSPDHLDDIATSLAVSDFGENVYIAASSFRDFTSSDYLLVNLNGSNGGYIWEQAYNGPASLPDAPVGLTLNNNILDIVGVSGTSSTKFDVTTLRYDVNGTLLDSLRYTVPGFKLDIPSDVTTDINGNIYITGKTTNNSTNYYMQTIKLNGSNLSLAWVKSYDKNNFEENGNSVTVDVSGNVYVTGFSTTNNGRTEMVCIKYDSLGNQLWETEHKVIQKSVSGSNVRIDGNGRLLIAGSSVGDGEAEWFLLWLDSNNGNTLKEENISTAFTSFKSSNYLHWIDSSTFILSGRDGSSYRSIQYNLYNKDITFDYDSLGNETWMNKAIIIRFADGEISPNFINDTYRQFDEVGNLLTNSVIEDMKLSLGVGDEIRRWIFQKIFFNMTMADSLTVTLSGDTILSSRSYNTILLLMPESFITNYSLPWYCSQLIANCPDVIYSQPNFVYQLNSCPANDVDYISGLQDGYSDPNIGIKADEGWCILGGGKDNIKVAIIDSGILENHEDFPNPSLYPNHIVKKNYINGNSLDQSGHGTSMAGLIGARRNNSIGVAGIAGGDFEQNGVQFAALKVFGGFGETTFTEYIAQALFDSYDNGIFQSNVVNMSFGPLNPDYNTFTDPATGGITEDKLLRNEMRLAVRAGLTLVASRGNEAGSSSANWPGTAQDEWVICVGGTGINGIYNPDDSYGLSIDVSAPSLSSLNHTTSNTNIDAYSPIDGTSSASAITAGVSALMLSYYYELNQELLAIEDIEELLAYSATDCVLLPGININHPQPEGPDQYTGAGRVNLERAAQLIESPNCKVFHFEAVTNDIENSPDFEVVSTLNTTYKLREGFMVGNVEVKANANGYAMQKVQIRGTFDIELPIAYNLVHAWARHSSSSAFGDVGPNEPDFGILTDFPIVYPVEKLVVSSHPSPSDPTISLDGYFYKINNVNTWIPLDYNTQQITFAYSVLGCINPSNTFDETKKESVPYPNPIYDNTLLLDIPETRIQSVHLSDIYGRFIELRYEGINENTIAIECSDLRSGVYFLTIIENNISKTFKIVKI